ncbi:nicotinamidase-related amidase [Rhizobium sp. ERR 922]|uniref:cysteine hydrolase family protein n=1 Tax=unclassified Rhizobium TaxID=2613769 RepID=UPI00119E5588|nr:MULTISPECIES: isochorismatase family cysteine hydrolase [unclassified Rhizobium]TWB46431.1 nicotinamidase-related amidase [Rhizobium sp. ERR 922]TWB88798.1 nicotinamidase-related amidase [Rhizobium sp. ERR 942]
MALIVVDFQKGIAAFPCVHPVDAVARKAGDMATAFRSRGLPVVLVNVTGVAPGRTEHGHPSGAFPPDFAELMPELNAQPSDHLVSKQMWGAFTGTDLQAYLRASDVTQVVVCGVATSIGVESTARQAHELGTNVTLAVDAMTDVSAEARANSLEQIFPRLGETGTA